VGRLFREFALTLSAAILVSLVVSLTLTPMMCARLLKQQEKSVLHRRSELIFERIRAGSGKSLGWALRHPLLIVALFAAAIGLNVYLYIVIPKGFFPQPDTGHMMGYKRAEQTTSFQSMQEKMSQMVQIERADASVDTVTAVTGGGFGARNSGFMFMALKPLSQRPAVGAVIARLRPQLARVPGANLFLVPVQDVRIGGRQGTGTYQYTLQSDDLEALRLWTSRLQTALQSVPQLADVTSDQETRGLQATLLIDRVTAARLGVTPDLIDSTLGNAFAQAIASTIYTEKNQYRVVMELDPRYSQGPEALKDVHLLTPGGARVPLAAVARYEYTNTPLSVNHQGQFAASTISFNLAEGVSLSGAAAAINETMARIGVPVSIQGSFQGTARSFQTTLARQPWLILAAILAMYIVLGVLYESVVHPLTILSTLPSGGAGAELRQPLGIAIVGGLILSQLLTLYTTPVVYLYLDRFRLWSKRVLRTRRLQEAA